MVRSNSDERRQDAPDQPGATHLHILLLEDNRLDAELIQETLRASGIEADFTRASTRDEFLHGLETGCPNLILSDYSLPAFDGISALALAHRRCPGVPFLFVSGAIGEELAIESLKNGATDYVLKHRLDRLVPAVERALREAQAQTERERAEQALHASEERYRALAEELAEAARRKDEFLEMLSHELRNPLASIRNGLEVMRRSAPDDPDVEETRTTVERQVQHLSRLVDDLLDVFGISHGKIALRVELLDLVPLVRRVTRSYHGPAHDGGLILTLDLPAAPVWVVADPARFAQVVSKVVHNALKFTGSGGSVAVRLAVDEPARQAILTVRDTGIGIRAEDLPHLFHDFSQIDPGYARPRGGLGVGLSLVKGLVEMHSGTVEAHSPGAGAGAEVTVCLPLAPDTSGMRATTLSANQASRALRILVVEDNRDAARTMQLLLKRYGFEVAVAYTGTAGVQLAQHFRPHVVLCDLGLPEMDGFDVARALRGDPAIGTARLIAVSGFGQEEDRRRAYEAGFNLHLTKPVDPEELERVLAAQASLLG
ncbi:MAG: response regulator [Gemmataceae bacterium]|nr:response regulator [Gemmataceae bacterium]